MWSFSGGGDGNKDVRFESNQTLARSCGVAV